MRAAILNYSMALLILVFLLCFLHLLLSSALDFCYCLFRFVIAHLLYISLVLCGIYVDGKVRISLYRETHSLTVHMTNKYFDLWPTHADFKSENKTGLNRCGSRQINIKSKVIRLPGDILWSDRSSSESQVHLMFFFLLNHMKRTT